MNLKNNYEIERERVKSHFLKFTQAAGLVMAFAVAGLFLFSGSAQAATYYVRGATICTNNGDGTLADCAASPGGAGAYNSISNAFSGRDLAPDDIVEVQGDTVGGSKTFTENVTVFADDVGSLGHHVVLRGRAGDTITIDGNGSTCVNAYNRSYLTISNLTLTGAGATGINLNLTGSDKTVTVDDIRCSGARECIWADGAVNSSFTNITTTGITRYGIYVAGANSTITVGNINVTGGGSAAGAIYFNTIKSVTVTGDLTATTNGQIGIYFSGVTDSIIINSGATLTSTNSGLYGVHILSSDALLVGDGDIIVNGSVSTGLLIKNSTFDSGSYLKNIDISNVTSGGIGIENADNIAVQDYNVYDSGAGVSVISGSTGVTFTATDGQFSSIHDTDGDGFSTSGAGTTATIKYTKIYNNGGGGIPTENGGSEGDGITGHDTVSVTAINNLIYDNDNTCFAFINSSNLTAYNNTCYSNGVSGGPRGGYFNTSNGTTVIKNDIFSENLPFEIVVSSAHLDANTTLDNNLYYHPIDNKFADTNANGTMDYATLSSFSDITNQDANSVEGNPLFNNAAGNDFTLTATSLAIDAGVDLTATIPTDYVGSSRYDMPSIDNSGSGTIGYVDIGAYEYITPPTPTLTSSTHPSISTWYNTISPVTMEFTSPYSLLANVATTKFNYLINQVLSPSTSSVKAGTTLNDAITFDAADSIATDGTWYVHAIAQNENDTDEYSDAYNTYTIKYDATAPTSSTISINSGGAYATSAAATLTLSSTDATSGLSQMQFSCDNTTWTTAEAYATSKSFNITNESGANCNTTEGTKTIYVKYKDAAGNWSAEASDTIIYDTVAPTISIISSDKTNGSYKAGEIIDIDLAFSENITTTDTITVTLETGTTDRTCTFSGVANASAATCNYTVQAGDISADLTVNTVAGTIADQAGNAMADFVPVANLAASKDLIIDTAAPTLSFSDDVASDPAQNDTIVAAWGDATVLKWDYDTDGTCSNTAGDYSKTDADSISQTAETNNGKYICLYGEDAAGNKTTLVSANDINIDITAPTDATLSLGTITATSITATVSGSTDANAGLHANPYYFDRNSAEAVSDWQAGITWADTGLTSNTEYSYKVKTRDAASAPNESIFTATQSRYTLAPTPTNLAADTVGQTAITLTVDAINNPTVGSSGYYFANTTNSANSDWIQADSWQDTGLTCGTSYNYTVKYQNGDGTETDTIALTQATANCPVVEEEDEEVEEVEDTEEIEDLDISDIDYESTENSITVKWKTNNKADSKVKYGKDRDMNQDEEDDNNEKSHKIVLKNLNPNTHYYFKIISEDENGSKDSSDRKSIKTKKENAVIKFVNKGLIKLFRPADNSEENKEETSGNKSGEKDLIDQVNEIPEKIQEKIEEQKFFNTKIFKKAEQKYLVEVKFQLVDKLGNPIANIPVTLHSDPQTTMTDENGVATFQNVPTGKHTLAFSHGNEKFEKKLAIAEPKAENGTVKTEIVTIKAEKDSLPLWAWGVIGGLAVLLVIVWIFRRKTKQAN